MIAPVDAVVGALRARSRTASATIWRFLRLQTVLRHAQHALGALPIGLSGSDASAEAIMSYPERRRLL